MEYPFETLTINKREIRLRDIQQGTVSSHTAFESDTFSFIRQWMSDVHEFTFQTSGSTGDPKIIVFSRDQLIQSALATIDALELKAGDAALVCLNTKYVAGKMMLIRAFVNNMRIIAAEPSSNPFRDIRINQPIDFVALVPLQLETILKEGFQNRLNMIKKIIIGGAAIHTELKSAIENTLHTDVYATYGMTETISHIALQKIHPDINFFSALPDVKIQPDDRGCLVIKIPYVKESVVTNDLVQFLSENTFKWLGRIDHVINSGGIKVIPEKVEAALETIFAQLNVSQKFLVAGIPDKILGSKVILLLEGTPLPSTTETAFFKEAATTLEKVEIPKQIITVAEFKLTQSGKIDRRGIVEEFLSRGYNS